MPDYVPKSLQVLVNTFRPKFFGRKIAIIWDVEMKKGRQYPSLPLNTNGFSIKRVLIRLSNSGYFSKSSCRIYVSKFVIGLHVLIVSNYVNGFHILNVSNVSIGFQYQIVSNSFSGFQLFIVSNKICGLHVLIVSN